MEWISVKDRLPEEYRTVLTLDNDPLYPQYKIDYVVSFPDDNPPFIWARRIYDEQEKVTHWMPLPQPPKEQK